MAADGCPFSQNVHARNVSAYGAKLSGLEKELNPGDIIGVQLGGKKARCKVIWAANTGREQKIEVGVALLEGQPSPWQTETEARRVASAPISAGATAPKEKRKFSRQRVPFPIEIRDEQSAGTHMQTNTADIGGGGCYIETRLPLPVGKVLTIIFWLNSAKIQTTGIVRTCDGGVGMGIEFTGLAEATKIHLQEVLEAMALEAAPFAKAHSALQ